MARTILNVLHQHIDPSVLEKADDSGAGKVDPQNPSEPPREKQHPSVAKPWMFKPGQSGNPSGKNYTIQNLTNEFRAKLLEENQEQAAKIAKSWLHSGDPFVQKLFFEYIVGKPKEKTQLPGGNTNNLDSMRSAMRVFEEAKQMENRIAELESQLGAKVING